MDRKTKQEWSRKYSLALDQHLRNENWEKVEEVLPAAENIGVSTRQLQKAWVNLGSHQKGKGKLVSALVSFASARKHALDNNHVLSELLDCFKRFVDLFEQKFSREDLVRLEYGLDRLYSFQRTRPKTSDANLERAKELLTRIQCLKEEAPSKRETPATPHVLRIFAALHSDMTIEEVRVEYAKIVAPMIRKKLREGVQKSGSPKAFPSKKRKKRT